MVPAPLPLQRRTAVIDETGVFTHFQAVWIGNMAPNTCRGGNTVLVRPISAHNVDWVHLVDAAKQPPRFLRSMPSSPFPVLTHDGAVRSRPAEWMALGFAPISRGRVRLNDSTSDSTPRAMKIWSTLELRPQITHFGAPNCAESNIEGIMRQVYQ